MLEYFRNAAKSWVAKVLLGLLVLSFAIFGISDTVTGLFVKDLATVGSQTVTGADYTRAVSRTMQQYSQQSGTNLTFEEMRKLGLDLQVRDSLIAGAAIDEQAKDLGLSVSADYIVQQTASNPAFQSGGKFERGQFQRVLEANGLNEETYILSEQRNLIRKSLVSSSDTQFVPKTLLDAMYTFQNETRDARYFTVSANEADVRSPSDDEVKKRYEAFPGIYTAPEYRSAVVMSVFPSDIAAKFEASDAELKDAFEEFGAEFSVPEKRTYLQVSFASLEEANKAVARVNGGDDLAKIAADLGFKSTDVTFENKAKSDIFDAKIGDVVFSATPNAVVGPVVGELTTALIKVSNVTSAKTPTLEELRPEMLKRVQMQKALDDIQSVYDTVEEARSNQKPFEDIARQLGIPLTVIPAVSAAGLDKLDKPVTVAGGEETLRNLYASDVGLEADALNLNDGFVWYEIREVIPSAVRPLDQVKETVVQDWKAGQLRDIVTAKAKTLIEKANSGTPFESLAAEAN